MPDSLQSVQHQAVRTGMSNAAPSSAAPVEEHITIEEPDSVLGSYFVGHPAPLASHVLKVDSLPSVSIPMPTDTLQDAAVMECFSPEVREMFHLHKGMPTQPSGLPGDPVDYQFRNDDVVTGILMLSFFIMAWVIAASWKFVRSQLRDFFITRERPNLFDEREDNVLRGRGFMVVMTCFLISLLFFTVTRDRLPEVFAQVSPYVLLGMATAVSIVYYVAKIALYNIVNHTFFSPAKCRMWNDIYLVSVLVTGCALLPIVLCVVFFDMPFEDTAFLCILLLGVIKSLLLYKCFRIFFSTALGCMHLFLYLCALEIIPLGIFAYSLVSTSTNLLSY